MEKHSVLTSSGLMALELYKSYYASATKVGGIKRIYCLSVCPSVCPMPLAKVVRFRVVVTIDLYETPC